MNIAVMTMHSSFSIGASLQAYAICKKLQCMGHSVTLIYYTPKRDQSIYDVKPIEMKKSIRAFIRSILAFKRNQLRTARFISFKDEYHPSMTQRYSSNRSLRENPPIFDAYICGSDQIWNPEHIDYDGSYFLDFLPSSCKRKVSYAASIGMDMLTEREIVFLKKNLAHIDYISVRENESLRLIVDELGIENAERHIDPTLLFDKAHWSTLEAPVKEKLPDKYILFYPMAINPVSDDILRELKKKTNLSCVVVSGRMKRYSEADVQITAAGPREYLYLFSRANIVLTNSFHGVAFSVIYEKPLVTYRHPTRNIRMYDLLQILGMAQNQCDSLEDFLSKDWNSIWKTGYSEVNKILALERKRSNEYLDEVLK